MIFLDAFSKEKFNSLLTDFSPKLKEYCKEAYPAEYINNYRGASDGSDALVAALTEVSKKRLDDIKTFLVDCQTAIIKECRGGSFGEYKELMDALIPTDGKVRKNDYNNRLHKLRLFLSYLALHKVVRLNCMFGSHPKSTNAAERISLTKLRFFMPPLASDFWIGSTLKRFGEFESHIQTAFFADSYNGYLSHEKFGTDTLNQSFKRMADIIVAHGITNPSDIKLDTLLNYHNDLIDYHDGYVPAYNLKPALGLFVYAGELPNYDFYGEFTKLRAATKSKIKSDRTSENIYKGGTKMAVSLIGEKVQNVEEVRVPVRDRKVLVDYGYWHDASGSDTKYSPDNLDSKDIWIAAQLDYIRSTSTEAATVKQKRARLSLLNKYLFSYLPAYFSSGLSGQFTLPKAPSDLIHSLYIQRSNVFELENEAKFTDGFQYPVSLPQFVYDMTSSASKHNTKENNSGRDALAVISHFFDYLSSLDSRQINDFRNPLLGKAKENVGRKFIKNRKYVFSLNYWLGLRSFCKAVTNQMLDDVLSSLKSGVNSLSTIDVHHDVSISGDAELLIGRVSLKSIPQLKLTKDDSVVRKNGVKDTHIYVSNYTPWAMMTLLLHSGIRRSNALWLDDRYCFDLVCDGKEFQQLLISTDKARTEAYSVAVSSEIVDLLRKVKDIKDFAAKANPKLAATIPYSNHEESKWGDISPLFRIKEKYGDSVVPHCFSEIINEYESFLTRNSVGFEPTTLYAPSQHYVLDEFIYLRGNGDGHIDTRVCEISVKYVDDANAVSFVPMVKKTLITPHSLRTMTVSIYAPIVGADIVGKLLTGQSEETVGFYTKQLPDSASQDFVNHLAYLLTVGKDGGGLVTVATTQINKQKFENDLKNAPKETITKYNAQSINFDMTEDVGNQLNGLAELGRTNPQNIAYFRTHICPVGGFCPKKVIDDIGEKHCYACPLTVITNNHLPAIGATIRSLCEEIKNINTKLEHFENMLATEFEELERRKTQCVAEASYWQARKGIAQESNDGNTYYVSEEGIEWMYEFKPQEASEQALLLLRLRETQGIPTLQSEYLSNQAARLRRKIQVLSKAAWDEFSELSDIEYLAQLFNVKSDIHGLSNSDKVKLLSIAEE
ncbi:TPA: hypothetical protein NGU14_003568 [Vibrio parahaemolyticus]|nr:hypothetical protein [Vibrio parahaemolyticus]HCG8455026.1 hypothetical protein [Vibrio parahaemolyticus]